MDYSIEITVSAAEMLTRIRDRRIRRLLVSRIDNQADEPEKQGRSLGGALAGQRSCRAVGQRYRIIYRIDVAGAVVVVVAVGLRRAGDRSDVYALAERLARLGLL